MGLHQAPTDGAHHPSALRAFLSACLCARQRSASTVGFEMLGTPQRDITPEIAAERLRELAKASH
jgi:UDPglucose--hexose-1-phosphate uridylyltransferase